MTVITLLSFDPNYSYDNADEEGDIEGYDGYEDYVMDMNADDSSWVVRRAACRALLEILSSGYEMDKDDEEKIIKKLIIKFKNRPKKTL